MPLSHIEHILIAADDFRIPRYRTAGDAGASETRRRALHAMPRQRPGLDPAFLLRPQRIKIELNAEE